MAPEQATAKGNASEKPKGLTPTAWAALTFVTFLLVVSGVSVIVTREAVPFRGQGAVTLEPLTAWGIGIAMIAGGMLLPLLAHLVAKRPWQPASDPRPASVSRIELLDTVFTVSGLAAVFAWAYLGVRAFPGWGALAFAAVLATAYTVYKIGRLVFEYRAGVSVHFGFQSRVGPDYERATRPVAFWWAIAIEVFCLLLGAGLAVVLWIAVASR
jgi:hypothetical protein